MREGEKKSTENRQEEEEEMSKVNCLFDETGSGKGKMKILKYLLLHLLDYSTYNLRWKRSVRLKRGTMTDRDQYRTAVAHAECTRSPILHSTRRLTFPHLPQTTFFLVEFFLSFLIALNHHQQQLREEEDTLSISSFALPIALLSFVRSSSID